MINLIASSDPMSHILPHPLSEHLPAWFTNHMLMALIAAALTVLIMVLCAKKMVAAPSGDGIEHFVPKGGRNLIESVMQYLREEVARPILGDDTDRFIPFLWSLFFFILICNLLGLVPLSQIFMLISGGRLQHLGGTATAGLSVTAGLATVAFLVIQGSGIWEISRKLWKGIDLHGHDHAHEGGATPHHPPAPKPLPVALFLGFVLYWWNFAPHLFKPENTRSFTDVLLWVVDILFWSFLLVLELIGALVKPFALAMRLFANMMAGHVVLASPLIMVPAITSISALGVALPTILGSALLGLLELFVAFLQAYIFAFLTCLFIGAAVHPEH